MLTPADRAKVLAITREVALQIYPEESFGRAPERRETVARATAAVG